MKTYRLSFIVLILSSVNFALGAEPTAPTLRPGQIALIINANNNNSRALADYYCLKRHVPPAHIIA